MKKLVNVFGKSNKRTSIRDIRLIFEVTYIYGVVTKQQQTNIIQKHETEIWLQLVKVKSYTDILTTTDLHFAAVRRTAVRSTSKLANRLHKSG
jgi:hypothetical protein